MGEGRSGMTMLSRWRLSTKVIPLAHISLLHFQGTMDAMLTSKGDVWVGLVLLELYRVQAS